VCVCVCVSTIKSKSIVYLFPFTLISDFINIRRAGVVLCLFVFSGGKAGRDYRRRADRRRF